MNKWHCHVPGLFLFLTYSSLSSLSFTSFSRQLTIHTMEQRKAREERRREREKERKRKREKDKGRDRERDKERERERERERDKERREERRGDISRISN